ncbi:HAD family hydrolase [Pontibaca salina]|uniref:phosphoglycolate phosphatase n=1 Tax=Pontibaca salina TaxID=2795731 RepID=A0A934HSP7_9RHOB|nr:HAD family hydrolase [Pontibaca salina]MBI6630005.1 HAD family hydrolase [Pontibaca salina]
MPVAAILFDKDGTLFEFGATWESWARAFLLRVTGNDPARASRIGLRIGFDMTTATFRPDSVVIAGTPAEIVAALAPNLPEIAPSDLLDRINEEAELAPQKQAVPLAGLLDDLRARGLGLGVATNDAEAPARAHLAGAGVLERFDFVAGFDSGYGAKPQPGQLLAFARLLDLAPERVVMVGDSTHDLLAGRAAGMKTVGVLTGLAREPDLAPHADVVLPDIGYLPDWL